MSKSKVLETVCGVGYIPMYSVKNVESAAWVIDEINDKKPEVVMVLTEDIDALKAIVAANAETLVGAGNVLCADACENVINAGVSFVVSPCFDEKSAEIGNSNRVSTPNKIDWSYSHKNDSSKKNRYFVAKNGKYAVTLEMSGDAEQVDDYYKSFKKKIK